MRRTRKRSPAKKKQKATDLSGAMPKGFPKDGPRKGTSVSPPPVQQVTAAAKASKSSASGPLETRADRGAFSRPRTPRKMVSPRRELVAPSLEDSVLSPPAAPAPPPSPAYLPDDAKMENAAPPKYCGDDDALQLPPKGSAKSRLRVSPASPQHSGRLFSNSAASKGHFRRAGGGGGEGAELPQGENSNGPKSPSAVERVARWRYGRADPITPPDHSSDIREPVRRTLSDNRHHRYVMPVGSNFAPPPPPALPSATPPKPHTPCAIISSREYGEEGRRRKENLLQRFQRSLTNTPSLSHHTDGSADSFLRLPSGHASPPPPSRASKAATAAFGGSQGPGLGHFPQNGHQASPADMGVYAPDSIYQRVVKKSKARTAVFRSKPAIADKRLAGAQHPSPVRYRYARPDPVSTGITPAAPKARHGVAEAQFREPTRRTNAGRSTSTTVHRAAKVLTSRRSTSRSAQTTQYASARCK